VTVRASDIAATLVTVFFGAVTGWFIAGPILAVAGGVGGLAYGVIASRANVRPSITTTVFVGSMAGALIGASIVETICLPGSCVAAEAGAAVALGLASFVGVGLVAALVTRSFDEYNESVASGGVPPGAGCESEPYDPPDSESV
jgi:hypothetical protein